MQTVKEDLGKQYFVLEQQYIDMEQLYNATVMTIEEQFIEMERQNNATIQTMETEFEIMKTELEQKIEELLNTTQSLTQVIAVQKSELEDNEDSIGTEN